MSSPDNLQAAFSQPLDLYGEADLAQMLEQNREEGQVSGASPESSGSKLSWLAAQAEAEASTETVADEGGIGGMRGKYENATDILNDFWGNIDPEPLPPGSPLTAMSDTHASVPYVSQDASYIYTALGHHVVAESSPQKSATPEGGWGRPQRTYIEEKHMSPAQEEQVAFAVAASSILKHVRARKNKRLIVKEKFPANDRVEPFDDAFTKVKLNVREENKEEKR